MQRTIILFFLQALLFLPVVADERTIDISGNNTSSSSTSYGTSISLPAGDVLNVKLARYAYFSSTISGSGLLNLYAGGERGYLGNSDKKWNDWSGYTGDVHIYPFKENAPSAGMYAVVLMHGGKAFSPENIDLSKVNRSLENNRVILHEGATLCTEANTAGSGFRIGELNTEVGSTLQGYMKNSRAAYYMLGLTNTDATLAGKIAPADYRDDTPLGIIKEGKGTYTITGNNNYLSGGLRILEGRVLVMNDRGATERGKLRGALGAKASATEAIAFVFGKGVLGGTGSIGGTVDNYGVIEPGAYGIGFLTLKNYATAKDANLFVHPSSELRIKVGSTANFDQIAVDGQVKYSSQTEDFSTSEAMPVVKVEVAQDADVQVGDEFRIMTAKSKSAGDWHFDVKANKYTWVVDEREENGSIVFVLRLVSLEDMSNPDNPDNPDNPVSMMGAFYDDGINDAEDKHSLKYYANLVGKSIGTAISLYKNDITDANLAETQMVTGQFNMLVAENEMKPEAFGGQNGSFSFFTADKFASFAKNKKMVLRGHCLVWNQQSPTWISSDGGKTNDKNWTREEALAIMKSHITNVMQHYKGKVREWDVVNECLDDNQSTVRTNPDGYDLRQNSVWQQAIGDDYVDSAFVYAHRADPDAILYLNDYGVELQGKAKSLAFYNLAMRLKNSNIPIDGVGLQCHFSIGDVDSVKLDNTIRRFEEAGLLCIITELDMGIPDTSEKYLEEQARNYRVITDIMLNHDNCPSMVIWGLKDNNSWRESSNPLLFTAQLDKKPAWYAVRSALRHRYFIDTAIRPVELHNDANNSAVYDLMGRRVDSNSLQPGIYVRGGKKFVIKK